VVRVLMNHFIAVRGDTNRGTRIDMACFFYKEGLAHSVKHWYWGGICEGSILYWCQLL